MDDAFRSGLQTKLAGYDRWSCGRFFHGCRLIQYCGVEMVGAVDVPLAEVKSQIEGLVCEGFRVDWAEHKDKLYLRVWESDGPEPDWSKVVAEQPLADINELLRGTPAE